MQDHSLIVVERFWNDRCEISENAKVPKGEAYVAYCAFALGLEAKPLSIGAFAKTLQARPCVQEGRTKRGRYWQGFQLIDRTEAPTSKIEMTVKEIFQKQDVEPKDELILEEKSKPNSHNPAFDELVRRSLFGVWERRKI